MAINAKKPDSMSVHARELYDRCSAMNAENELPEMIRLLEEAVSECPDSIEILTKLSGAYRQSGSPGKAIKLLENSAENCGCDIRMQLELANSYADRKWNKKAKQKYTECFTSDKITPEMIQEISESCLDMCEYDFLEKSLSELSEKRSGEADTRFSAVCIAMLYALMGECAENNKECGISETFIDEYSERHKDNVSEDLYRYTIHYLSETPNTSAVLPLFRHIVKTAVAYAPSVAESHEFQKVLCELELSVILYSSEVTTLTVLAMRFTKDFFGDENEKDPDLTHYLAFDAALALINAAAQNRLSRADVNSFAEKYVYLWQLISKLTMTVLETPDLQAFFRNYVYNNIKNATDGFCEHMKNHLPADQYELIMSLRNVRKTPVRSSKISPNSPCPCGSGKKYKKCCGLNK